MNIKKVCVIGGGQMGRQIALCAALRGYAVGLYDSIPSVCDQVSAWKDAYLTDRAGKGKMSKEQAEMARTCLSVSNELEAVVKDTDLIIEAIVEIYEAKAELFRKLDGIICPEAIVATNSSYMVSSQFRDCFTDPSRLLNCHFYNPALTMKFVEVTQGPHTAPEVAETTMEFCRDIGKVPILMKKELSGFAANRFSKAILEEACFLVGQGYLTFQEVDTACELGLNHPMGPFRLIDFVGVDVAFDIMRSSMKEGDPKPDCYDLLEGMVKEGHLGRKTGKGFYQYS